MQDHFLIQKEFAFEASHILIGLPAGHKCSNLHGHNYKVTILLAANKLDENGFVVDFGELEPIKKWIAENLDHAHIATDSFEATQAKAFKKALLGIHYIPEKHEQKVYVLAAPTSAENIAKLIYYIWSARYPEMIAVTVKETDSAGASYRPIPDMPVIDWGKKEE